MPPQADQPSSSPLPSLPPYVADWMRAGLNWSAVFDHIKKDLSPNMDALKSDERWIGFVNLLKLLPVQDQKSWWLEALKKESRLQNKESSYDWMKVLFASFPEFLHPEPWSKSPLAKSRLWQNGLLENVNFDNPGWAGHLLFNAVEAFNQNHSQVKRLKEDLHVVFSLAPPSEAHHRLAWAIAFSVWSKQNASHVTENKLKAFSALQNAGLTLCKSNEPNEDDIPSLWFSAMDRQFAPFCPSVPKGLSIGTLIAHAKIDLPASVYREILEEGIKNRFVFSGMSMPNIVSFGEIIEKKAGQEDAFGPVMILNEEMFLRILNSLMFNPTNGEIRGKLVRWMESGLLSASDTVLKSPDMASLGIEGEEFILRDAARKTMAKNAKDFPANSELKQKRMRLT